MAHKKDLLWKGVLEWVFEDLLRFLFPDADHIFDLGRGFGFLEKELLQICPEPEREITNRHVDKLVKVNRKSGKEEWVLVHLEVQGETKAEDRLVFGERMFRYFNLIFARYNRPIAAIAIFTGPDGRLMPDTYEYYFMNTQLVYQFNTLNIQDFSDEELIDNSNPFSWVILIAKQALLSGKDLDKRLLQGKLFIFRKLYENDLLGRKKIQAILTFLDLYLVFENPQTNRIFREEVDQITGKTNTMDIFELAAEIRLEEARQEARESFVKELLAQTEFSDDKIASLTHISVEEVAAIRRQLK